MLLLRRVRPVRRHRAAARVSPNPNPSARTSRPRPPLAPPSPLPPQKLLEPRVGSPRRPTHQIYAAACRSARDGRRFGEEQMRGRKQEGSDASLFLPRVLRMPPSFFPSLNQFCRILFRFANRFGFGIYLVASLYFGL
uniref:Uncharacterized protein n=1 Tax=Arundo donax TaxID=35708 RepID=A0A0A8XWZ1_ARUDO